MIGKPVQAQEFVHMADKIVQAKETHQNAIKDICSQVLQNIRNHYPPTIKAQARTILKECSVVICGAPRIGKSSLINAIVGKEVATTSTRLGPCTKKIESYPMIDPEKTTFQTRIYDTPGVEEWNESITDILKTTAPIVLVFCMAPRCWTPIDKLKTLLNECFKLEILVALVCTNMWIGQKDKYKVILKEFDDLLVHLLEERKCAFAKSEANGVIYFRKKKEETDDNASLQTLAFYTAVNSKPYDYLNVYKEPSGIIELIDAITISLNPMKVTAWCFTILANDGYWSQMREATFQTLKERVIIFGKGTFSTFKSFTSWFTESKT